MGQGKPPHLSIPGWWQSSPGGSSQRAQPLLVFHVDVSSQGLRLQHLELEHKAKGQTHRTGICESGFETLCVLSGADPAPRDPSLCWTPEHAPLNSRIPRLWGLFDIPSSLRGCTKRRPCPPGVALTCPGHPGLLQHCHIPVSGCCVSSFLSSSSTERNWTAGPKPRPAAHTVPKGSKAAPARAGGAGIPNFSATALTQTPPFLCSSFTSSIPYLEDLLWFMSIFTYLIISTISLVGLSYLSPPPAVRNFPEGLWLFRSNYINVIISSQPD